VLVSCVNVPVIPPGPSTPASLWAEHRHLAEETARRAVRLLGRAFSWPPTKYIDELEWYTQEAYLALWLALPRAAELPVPDRRAAYLATCVRNHLSDVRRRKANAGPLRYERSGYFQAKQPQAEEAATASPRGNTALTPDAEAERGEAAEAVRAALDGLRKDAPVLHEYASGLLAERGAAEVGRERGDAERTAYRRAAEALAALRANMPTSLDPGVQ
jgi:DNA-directed RNA polymerase specialized sigma24 family protein